MSPIPAKAERMRSTLSVSCREVSLISSVVGCSCGCEEKAARTAGAETQDGGLISVAYSGLTLVTSRRSTTG